MEMGVEENNCCSFCQSERDSIAHLLIECEHVQAFWNDLTQCMREKCDNCARLTFVKNCVILLFGHHEDFKSDEGFDSI